MAKKVPGRDGVSSAGDLVAQAFVRGAQAGASQSHFRSIAAQNRALRDLLDALSAGANPVEALYRAAGVQAPPIVRQAAKDAKVKHIDDLLSDIDKNRAKAAKEKLDALKKASSTRAAQRTRDAGVFRRIPGIRSGVGSSGAGSTITILNTIQEEYFRRKLAERNARRAILAVGRRGALASRGFTPTGRTNRTGAAAQPRPAAPATASAGRTVRPSRSATGSTGGQGGTVRPVPGSSGTVADRRAREIMSSSPRLPTRQTTSQGQSPWQKIFSSQVGSALNGLLQPRVRLGTRAVSQLSASRSRGSSTSSRAPTASTSTQSLLSAMSPQASQSCNCPKPRQERKSSRARCTNPLVSRTVRDNFITIKRRIECQPSRPK